jgi:hypothetical protein
VDQRQAHQGKTSSSGRKTSFAVGLYGEYGNKRPNHVNRLAEYPYIPTPPASYAVSGTTRVVFNAVLIYECDVMMHGSNLHPMIAFQSPR